MPYRNSAWEKDKECVKGRVMEQCTSSALRQNILLSNREQPARGDSPTSLLGWIYYRTINNLGMLEYNKVLFTNCASDQMF